VHINELTETLGKYSTVKVIDTSWFEHLPEMKKLQKAELPQVLPYNRGVSSVPEKDAKRTVEDDEDDDEPAKTDLERAIDSNRSSNLLGLNKLGRAREPQPEQPPLQESRLPEDIPNSNYDESNYSDD
jgi:hypothetical protein